VTLVSGVERVEQTGKLELTNPSITFSADYSFFKKIVLPKRDVTEDGITSSLHFQCITSVPDCLWVVCAC